MEKNIVKKHWYEERTKGGYWSKVKHDYEETLISDAGYEKFVAPENLWLSDRITRSYTRLGYKPVRITNVSPNNQVRAVYEFVIK